MQAHTIPSHSEQRKPGSQIRLTSPAHFVMSQEQSLAAELVFDTAGVTGNIVLRLKADDGLRLMHEQSEWYFEQPLSKRIRVPVEIYSQAKGRQFLHIFVTEEQPSGNLSRTLALVIDVDKGLTQKPKTNTERALPAELEMEDSQGSL